MRKLDGLLGCLVVLALVGCDPGSKSVTGTADAGNDDGGEGGGTGDTGGDDDDDDDDVPANPTADDDDDDDDDEPPCFETVEVLDDTSAVTPGGFSPDEVIMLTDGWTVPFVWLPSEGPVEIEPAGTNTELDLGVTYSGGELRWVTSEANPDYPFDIAFNCDDRLELELDVTFATADGFLDESYSTIGMAITADELSFDHFFDPGDLQGMLWPDGATSEDGEITAFAMFGTIAEGQDPTGSFNVEVEIPGPDGGFVGFGVLGVFPELKE